LRSSQRQATPRLTHLYRPLTLGIVNEFFIETVIK
jgi:hypothetical protein